MSTRNSFRRLLVGLASLAVLAGCASGASPTPPPASSTPAGVPMAAVDTPTPSAVATPTPTPAAISHGPVAVVTGTGTCPVLDPAWTTDPDGTQHVRDLFVECIEATNDSRASGTHTATWNMDVWEGAAGVQWGTARLENAGGAWEGPLSGVYSAERGDTIMIWYTGTGGYRGLAYFELWTGQGPGRSKARSSPATLRHRRRVPRLARQRDARPGPPSCEPHDNRCPSAISTRCWSNSGAPAWMSTSTSRSWSSAASAGPWTPKAANSSCGSRPRGRRSRGRRPFAARWLASVVRDKW